MKKISRNGRSPHGERGLKFHFQQFVGQGLGSLPAWGAWIEISKSVIRTSEVSSRSPHGERGLKLRVPYEE